MLKKNIMRKNDIKKTNSKFQIFFFNYFESKLIKIWGLNGYKKKILIKNG